MKKRCFWAMMAISGALLLGACSSDDENLESQKVTPLSPLETVAKDKNEDMEGVDFKDLDTLDEEINSKTGGDSEDSEDEVKVYTLGTVLKADEAKGLAQGSQYT